MNGLAVWARRWRASGPLGPPGYLYHPGEHRRRNGLRPGVPFILQSKSINGTYNSVDVQFAGDTGFDTPFYVTAIGKLPG